MGFRTEPEWGKSHHGVLTMPTNPMADQLFANQARQTDMDVYNRWLAEIASSPEASYLRGLGQPLPAGGVNDQPLAQVQIVGPEPWMGSYNPIDEPRPDVVERGVEQRVKDLGEPPRSPKPGKDDGHALAYMGALISLGAAVAQAIAASKARKRRRGAPIVIGDSGGRGMPVTIDIPQGDSLAQSVLSDRA